MRITDEYFMTAWSIFEEDYDIDGATISTYKGRWFDIPGATFICRIVSWLSEEGNVEIMRAERRKKNNESLE